MFGPFILLPLLSLLLSLLLSSCLHLTIIFLLSMLLKFCGFRSLLGIFRISFFWSDGPSGYIYWASDIDFFFCFSPLH